VRYKIFILIAPEGALTQYSESENKSFGAFYLHCKVEELDSVGKFIYLENIT